MSAAIPEWLLSLLPAATRNAGLALLIATLDAVAPTIRAAVLAYIAYSFPVVLSYLAWRPVRARRAPAG